MVTKHELSCPRGRRKVLVSGESADSRDRPLGKEYRAGHTF